MVSRLLKTKNVVSRIELRFTANSFATINSFVALKNCSSIRIRFRIVLARPPSLLKTESLLYGLAVNLPATVMNAGYMTDYFIVSRGVRQGCPLSPFLFILSVELLALKIRQEPNCKSIRLPNLQEAKISQFADDTTLISKDTNSLKFSLQIIGSFGSISGLRLNKKKTKAMWIGSSKHKKKQQNIGISQHKRNH